MNRSSSLTWVARMRCTRKEERQRRKETISCFTGERSNFGNKSLTEVITASTQTNCWENQISQLPSGLKKIPIPTQRLLRECRQPAESASGRNKCSRTEATASEQLPEERRWRPDLDLRGRVGKGDQTDSDPFRGFSLMQYLTQPRRRC